MSKISPYFLCFSNVLFIQYSFVFLGAFFKKDKSAVIFVNPFVLIYFDKTRHDETFKYVIKSDLDNKDFILDCENYGEQKNSFFEDYLINNDISYNAALNLFNEIYLEKLGSSYFSFENNLDMCFVSTPHRFSKKQIKSEYFVEFVSHNASKPSLSIIPDFNYYFLEKECKSNIYYKLNADELVNLNLILMNTSDKNFVRCLVNKQEQYCNLIKVHDNSIQLLIQFKNDLQKTGVVVIEYACAS
jgi:hypothetical protein